MSNITIIGDYLSDHDIFYKIDRRSPDGMAVCKDGQGESRPGGAGAVEVMMREMFPEHHATNLIHANRIERKTRHILNNQVMFRYDSYDNDDLMIVGNPSIRDLLLEGKPEVVLVSDYGKGTITEESYQQILHYRHRNPASILIVDPHRTKSVEFYKGADGILPNREEAGLLHASSDYYESYCRDLLFAYPYICLKVGWEGMVVATRKIVRKIPGIRVRVLDTCGAGDIVAAIVSGVVALRGLEDGWVAGCSVANQMAAVKVSTRWGAVPVPLDLEEQTTQSIRSTHLRSTQ